MAFTSDEKDEAKRIVFELYKAHCFVLAVGLSEGGTITEELCNMVHTLSLLAARVFKIKDSTEGYYGMGTPDEINELRLTTFELYKTMAIGGFVTDGGSESSYGSMVDASLLVAQVFKANDSSSGYYDSVDITP